MNGLPWNVQYKTGSECVIDSCLTSNEQFFSYIMARTNNCWWDDDDTCFVLNKRMYMDCIVLARWTNSPKIDIMCAHYADAEATMIWYYS